MNSVFKVLLLLIVSLGRIDGLKYSSSYMNTKVDKYESYRVFTNQGIVSGGRVDVNYNIKRKITSNRKFNLNLLLLSSLQYNEWYNQMSDTSSDSYNIICSSPSVWSQTIQFSLDSTAPANPIGKFSVNVHTTDEYTLVVAFCTQLDAKHSFKVDLDVSYVNLDNRGEYSQYLPIEDVILPHVFKFLCFVYFILMTLWVLELASQYKEIQFVHIAVLVAILLQFFTLYMRYVEYSDMNANGVEDYDRIGFRKALDNLIDPFCLFLYYFVTMTFIRKYIEINQQNTLVVFMFWGMYMFLFILHVSCQFTRDDWSENGCQPYPVCILCVRICLCVLCVLCVSVFPLLFFNDSSFFTNYVCKHICILLSCWNMC
jgi:hypothetical protein